MIHLQLLLEDLLDVLELLEKEAELAVEELAGLVHQVDLLENQLCEVHLENPVANHVQLEVDPEIKVFLQRLVGVDVEEKLLVELVLAQLLLEEVEVVDGLADQIDFLVHSLEVLGIFLLSTNRAQLLSLVVEKGSKLVGLRIHSQLTL